MTAWRMAFRAGTGGEEMFRKCVRCGVASITYYPIAEVDLSEYAEGEPKELWSKLSSAQVYSLRQVAYKMKKGDVIYAKQGKMIVGKGIVKDGYQFDKQHRIIDPNNEPWTHQVPVAWLPNFIEVEISVGDQQRYTVRTISQDDVQRIEREEQRARARQQTKRK